MGAKSTLSCYAVLPVNLLPRLGDLWISMIQFLRISKTRNLRIHIRVEKDVTCIQVDIDKMVRVDICHALCYPSNYTKSGAPIQLRTFISWENSKKLFIRHRVHKKIFPPDQNNYRSFKLYLDLW
jgi:hypothetical protein